VAHEGHEEKECVHGVAGAACFQCFVSARRRRQDATLPDATPPDAMMEMPGAGAPAASAPFHTRHALTPAELQHRRRMLMHLTGRGLLALRTRPS